MRRVGRWIAAPFRLALLLVYWLFRIVAEILRTLRWIVFYVARIVGSGAGAVTFGICFALYAALHSPDRVYTDAPTFYVILIFGVSCRIFWRKLEPGPRRVRPPKAAKPAAIAVVTGSTLRSDDPNEATIIARLSPKLRSLLGAPGAG